MLTFKNNAYLLFLFKSTLKLLNAANKLWLYKIFWGDSKSHPPMYSVLCIKLNTTTESTLPSESSLASHSLVLDVSP